jgi:hypothetical protein
MAYDTDNNVIVQGFSGEAVIATDFVSTESNHFQVMKIAYGTSGVTGSATRVTSTTPLPVSILNNPTVAVSSIPTVTVTGTVAISGTSGVTATDLDIRSLTAGDPTLGLAPGADFVRIVGYSGGWAVGVTATNFGIRALTAGDPTTAGAAGQDTVRIVGYSGGWPIGVTATDLDIRSLTYGSDSVSVLNTLSVISGSTSPYTTSIADGFQTRVLRASTVSTPYTNYATFSAAVAAPGTVEDTVRVVGLSGAWPVSVFSHGLTNINNYDTKLPFNVDSTGALFVNLASGSISVTADVGSLNIGDVTISGISLGYPDALSKTISIVGYTGANTIPVAVTGSVSLLGQGLTYLSEISTSNRRVLGASGDYIGITGDVRDKINQMTFVNNSLFTFDANIPVMSTNVSTITGHAARIREIFDSSPSAGSGVPLFSSDSTNGAMIKVDVKRISQPDGVTSGTISVGNSVISLSGSVFTVKSGVHLKSKLTNTGTIYVGTNQTAMATPETNGFPLYAGDELFIETDSLTKMFFRADTLGNTLHYFAT